MKIEKLTENQIRITLNIDDLDENNINLHSFMSSSIESQDLFYTILDKAEKEIGFKTDNYKLMIEALSTPGGNFILTITRIKQELPAVKKKVQAKRKDIKLKDEVFIYKFDSFDVFCELCNYIKLEAPAMAKKLGKAKLYTYNSKYYFIFKNLNFNIQELKLLHFMFLEFSEYLHNSNLFENKLSEYGKLIIPKNAINLTNKYFYNKQK